jgi:hypothetical protein
VRPRQARYQAALRPDMKYVLILKHFPTLLLLRTTFFVPATNLVDHHRNGFHITDEFHRAFPSFYLVAWRSMLFRLVCNYSLAKPSSETCVTD